MKHNVWKTSVFKINFKIDFWKKKIMLIKTSVLEPRRVLCSILTWNSNLCLIQPCQEGTHIPVSRNYPIFYENTKELIQVSRKYTIFYENTKKDLKESQNFYKRKYPFTFLFCLIIDNLNSFQPSSDAPICALDTPEVIY